MTFILVVVTIFFLGWLFVLFTFYPNKFKVYMLNNPNFFSTKSFVRRIALKEPPFWQTRALGLWTGFILGLILYGVFSKGGAFNP
jgi:hypothetical protein